MQVSSKMVKDSLVIIASELRKNLSRLDREKIDQLVCSLDELRERGGWLHLNAVGRSGEVAALFGLQLASLGFNVQRLLPGQLFRPTSQGDIALHLSGSGRTLPTNLVLEVTKGISGLRNIALTAKLEASSWQQGLDLILQVPGRTKLREGAVEERIARALPMGSAFELGCTLLLQGVASALTVKTSGLISSMIHRLLEEAEGLGSQINEEATAEFIDRLVMAYHEKKRVFAGGLSFSNHMMEMFSQRLEQMGFSVASLFSRRLPRALAGDMLLLLSSGERGLQAIGEAARRDGLQIVILRASSQEGLNSDLSVPIPSPESWWSALLYLEAVVSALMARLNKREKDLIHTQPWLG